MRLLSQFLGFCVVGAVGFIVDAGMLYLLLAKTDVGPYYGRAVSYLIAATATWLLNRRYVFRASPQRGLIVEWMKYVFTNTLGILLNFGTYVLCLQLFAAAREYPVLGVAVGSCVGLGANFLSSKHIIFRQQPTTKT